MVQHARTMTRVVCVAGYFATRAAWALDPPHDVSRGINCPTCHVTHHAPGGAITKVAGNSNLCISCHSSGGVASALPFADTDEAIPGRSGTSHRWDSGVSGWVKVGSANTSPGRVQSSGAFSGRYSKTYTLTITTAGDLGTARFAWTTSSGTGATNVATATTVPLDDGIGVSFSNGTPSPSFRLNDQWTVFVHAAVNPPTTLALAARLADGKVTCSTCHNEHSQAAEPFDPAAPPYPAAGPGGEGRHNQRLDNNLNQMCGDCHAAHTVAAAAQGSHPVGITIPAGSYKPPATLPLDKTTHEVRCMSCHQLHASPIADGSLLRLANVTALCADCHTLADTATPAAHLNPATGVLWPGPQYGTLFPQISDTTKRGACTNCHQPHGWPDGANPTQDYPALLVNREEQLCYACHDGAPVAKNILAQVTKTYRHPTGDYSGRHRSAEGGNPASYGTTNRHAECEDCHNSHVAGADTSAPIAPAASKRLRGVGRVAVTNGPAGTVPAYTYRGPGDTSAPITEYQVCFKCHSSWTTQPAGQSNLAVKFNSNNASYHPVEAQGKNTNIRAGSFVNGWTATRLMYCTDCHTSDDPTVRGPHGAQYPFLLKRPFVASSARRTTASTEACFDCHSFTTYGTTQSNDTIQSYSRFNRPNYEKGHSFHVDEKQAPCYACHDSHGSATQPHLIVTGRNPGLNSYTAIATGGTCAPTCHGPKTYTLNYPR
jgi:predicted CXXCH cytochrome family protein